MHNPVVTPPRSAVPAGSKPGGDIFNRLKTFRRALWSILALAVIVLALVVLGEIAVQKPKTVEIGPAQAGSGVTLQNGDTLQLTLEGNLTTGYNWTVTDLNTAVLKPEGKPQFQASSSALGAGGTLTFRFKAVASGQTPLKLAYQRSFEPTIAPLQTYEVTVIVR